jgi:hypothetical protein
MKAVKLPLQAVDSRVLLTDDYPTIVKQNIIAAIVTYQDERVYRPEFGIDDPVFTAIDTVPGMLGLIKTAIAGALDEDFPDVTYNVLGSITEDGRLDLVVNYRCGDADPDSLETTI